MTTALSDGLSGTCSSRGDIPVHKVRFSVNGSVVFTNVHDPWRFCPPGIHLTVMNATESDCPILPSDVRIVSDNARSGRFALASTMTKRMNNDCNNYRMLVCLHNME